MIYSRFWLLHFFRIIKSINKSNNKAWLSLIYSATETAYTYVIQFQLVILFLAEKQTITTYILLPKHIRLQSHVRIEISVQSVALHSISVHAQLVSCKYDRRCVSINILIYQLLYLYLYSITLYTIISIYT